MTNEGARVVKEINDRVHSELLTLANRLALQLERTVVEVLEEGKKVVSGDLKKSIKSDVRDEVNHIIVTVFSGMGYAEDVYKGTPPHDVPIFPLARWVKLKGIGQKFTDAGRMIGTKRKKYTTEVGGTTISAMFSREVLRVAYMIKASIKKKGTKGYKFFDIALKRAEPEIQRQLNLAAKRIAQ